jgi:WD40 repeat protein
VNSTAETYNTAFKDFTNQSGMALSPDGHFLALFHSDLSLTARQSKGPLPRIEVFELDTQRRVVSRSGTSVSALRLNPYPALTYSPDGQRLFALGRGGELVVLSAGDLTVTRRIPLPTPPLTPSDGVDGWNTSIIPVSNDEVVMLYAGALTSWRIDTGAERGTLLPVRPELRQLRTDAPGARALGLPGQPGKVVIAIQDRVELWDLDQRRAVRIFQPWPEKRVTDISVNPRTSQVAVYYESVGLLELWNPERDGAARAPIPAALDNSLRPLKGFTDDNKLITVGGLGGGNLSVWDVDKGIRVGGFRPSGVTLTWEVHNNILLSPTQRGPVFIDMTPQHWIEHLCQINDRDYTTEERALLPPGADPTRPCH